jgi:putative peptidoglycan lipid II flippase
MSLPLLWPVHRLGVRLRPTLRFPDGAAGRARALASAGLGALVAQQISVLVAISLATRFGEPGTLLVYTSMQAVYFLPYAVLAFPLATASLPRLAEHAARGRRAAFATLASSTTRAVLMVSTLGAAALVAVAPAVEQVFEPIADGDVTGLAVGLGWTAPGLLGFGLILHLSRALYALDQGRAAVLATGAGWLLVSGTGWLLVPVLVGDGRERVATLQGLGLANSIGMTAAGVGLLIGLVRSAGRDCVDGLGRTLGVLAVGGVAGALLGRWSVDVVTGAAAQPSLGRAVAAGMLGAAVCAVIVGAASLTLDRSVLRGLRSHEPTVEQEQHRPGDDHAPVEPSSGGPAAPGPTSPEAPGDRPG